MDQFYRVVESIRIFKAPDAPRERGIRLYCTQRDASWMLQIRGPMSLGSSGYGREGKDFIIADARLDVEEMTALRDAINEFLKEVTL